MCMLCTLYSHHHWNNPHSTNIGVIVISWIATTFDAKWKIETTHYSCKNLYNLKNMITKAGFWLKWWGRGGGGGGGGTYSRQVQRPSSRPLKSTMSRVYVLYILDGSTSFALHYITLKFLSKHCIKRVLDTEMDGYFCFIFTQYNIHVLYFRFLKVKKY